MEFKSLASFAALFAILLLLAGCTGAPQEQAPPAGQEGQGAGETPQEPAGEGAGEAMGGGAEGAEASEGELPDSFEDVELTVNEDEWLEDVDALDEGAEGGAEEGTN